MDPRDLEAIDTFLGIVGAASLLDYYELAPDSSAEDIEEAVRERRTWAQGQQANNKYRDEALWLIKQSALLQRALVDDFDAYVAEVGQRSESKQLEVLSLFIQGALAGGTLSTDAEEGILEQGRSLGLDDATVRQRIERLLEESGARRGSPTPTSNSPSGPAAGRRPGATPNVADIRPVSLVRPDRETTATLPALEDLFRAAARDIRTRLVNRAGADIPVRLGVAQVSTVGDILEDTDTRDGGVFGVFRFNPLGLPGLLIIQGSLLARLVGVLLGEDPDAEAPPYRVRPVTRVEMRFCRRVVEDVLESLSAAWPTDTPPRLEIEMLGSNPRLAKGLSQTTSMVAASLDFGPPYAPYGLMTVAVPGQATRDLQVPDVAPISAKVRNSRYDAQRVMPVRLTAIAELARTDVTLRELHQLEPGSVLDLGPRQTVQVRINGRVVMTGEPGSKGGSHSVRILTKVQS